MQRLPYNRILPYRGGVVNSFAPYRAIKRISSARTAAKYANKRYAVPFPASFLYLCNLPFAKKYAPKAIRPSGRCLLRLFKRSFYYLDFLTMTAPPRARTETIARAMSPASPVGATGLDSSLDSSTGASLDSSTGSSLDSSTGAAGSSLTIEVMVPSASLIAILRMSPSSRSIAASLP